MASALERRLGALERSQLASPPKTLILRFVGFDRVPEPLMRLSVGMGGPRWLRLPDEPEEAFVARVKAAVPVEPGCCRVLMGG